MTRLYRANASAQNGADMNKRMQGQLDVNQDRDMIVIESTQDARHVNGGVANIAYYTFDVVVDYRMQTCIDTTCNICPRLQIHT